MKVEKLADRKLGKIVDLTKQNTVTTLQDPNKDLEIFEDAKTNKYEDFQQEFTIENPIKQRIGRFKRKEWSKDKAPAVNAPFVPEGIFYPPVRESSYSVER